MSAVRGLPIRTPHAGPRAVAARATGTPHAGSRAVAARGTLNHHAGPQRAQEERATWNRHAEPPPAPVARRTDSMSAALWATPSQPATSLVLCLRIQNRCSARLGEL